MVWRVDDPQANESAKIKYDIVPYTRGKGLDLGCGPYKAFPHFIGVDNGHHWGVEGSDVAVDTCEDLSLFSTESMDFVFSSHLLEHIEDTRAALHEWWRVVKPGGHLVLYLPHKDLYPNCGEEGANPDHKHDFLPEDIRTHMGRVGCWDLLVEEERNTDNGAGRHGNEYSFLQVYRKRGDNIRHNLANEPKPEKTVCVVRYGAFGDLIQASSVFPALKEQGYHVTLMTTPQGWDIVKHDPHIDDVVLQDKNQVPNEELGPHWDAWEKKFDKFINLSESIEEGLLARPRKTLHRMNHGARHAILNVNYWERTHVIAEVPMPPRSKFYPSEDEVTWAKGIRDQFGPQDILIMWVMSGSSIHKRTPFVDQVISRLMVTDRRVQIITVGDMRCKILEQGWEDEPRVHLRSGEMSIRETMSLAQQCDVVVGPETGVLNAVGLEEAVAKVVFLSHSSEENLTKYWVNTSALYPEDVPCYPCHQMHYDDTFCPQIEVEVPVVIEGKVVMAPAATSKCVAGVTPDMIHEAIVDHIGKPELNLETG